MPHYLPTDQPTAPDDRVLHTYAPGALVQLVAGNPRSADADIAQLAGATIRITTTRVSALVGDHDWSWNFAEIENIAHADGGAWTIFVVPGVDDHGVEPKPEDVVAFRRALDDALLDFAGVGLEPEPEAEPVVVDDARVSVVIHQRFEGWSGGHLADEADVAAPAASEPDAPYFAPAPTAPVAAVAPAPTATALDPNGLASLEARGISAWFADHHVLDRVSLHMHAGHVTALIGPSGCGKSTFLRILNRMHEMIPSASLAGEVLLDRQDIYDIERKLTDARRQIGMVFQKPNPFPAMSIYDNVVAGFRLTGTKISSSEKDAVVETCLTKAGLWTEVRDRLRSPGGGLSGGQQQRLCIARSLAIQPRVLLMDEPCSALDPTSTRRIEQTIVELKSEVTIVIVTHNMQQANRVSDQCAFFLAEAGQPGVIVEHGDTEAMFHNPIDERTNAYVNGRFG